MRKFFRDNRAATIIEYSVLAALVATVVAPALVGGGYVTQPFEMLACVFSEWPNGYAYCSANGF